MEMCSRLGLTTPEVVQDFRIIKGRLCGPDRSKYDPNVWSRKELEELAVNQGMSKYRARAVKKGELCTSLASQLKAQPLPGEIGLIPTVGDYIGRLDYKGSPSYIMPIIYHLLSKHKDACMYINDDLEDDRAYYGIHVTCPDTISIAVDLVPRMKACKSRFYICLIRLSIPGVGDAHANFLLYDREKATVTLFEPRGDLPECPKRTLNKYLRAYFKVKLKATLVRSLEICPKKGPQSAATIKHMTLGLKHKYDTMGFCAAWVIFMLDMRLSYPDVSMKRLVYTTLDLLDKHELGSQHYIMEYIQETEELRKSLMDRAEIYDINFPDFMQLLLLKEVKGR